MTEKTNVARLEEAAAAQWGLFTTAQAARMGVSRQQVSRLAKSGKVERLSSSVYGFRGAPEDPYAETKAAWLSTNPKLFAYERVAPGEHDAVVTGATAAHLYEVGSLYPSPYTFSTTRRRQSQRSNIRYLNSPVAEEDVALVDGLPVARPAKVIADLVRAHEDPSLVRDVAVDFEQSGHIVNTLRLAQLLREIRGPKTSVEEVFQGYERLPLMLARDEQGMAGFRLAAVQELLHQSTAHSKSMQELLASLSASELPGLRPLSSPKGMGSILASNPALLALGEAATPLMRFPFLEEAIRAHPSMSIIGQELAESLAALSASCDKLAQSNASLMDSIARSTQALAASTEGQANE